MLQVNVEQTLQVNVDHNFLVNTEYTLQVNVEHIYNLLWQPLCYIIQSVLPPHEPAPMAHSVRLWRDNVESGRMFIIEVVHIQCPKLFKGLGISFRVYYHPMSRPRWLIRSACGSTMSSRVGCLSSRLCIYSAPNCSKAWGVQCCLWYCAL